MAKWNIENLIRVTQAQIISQKKKTFDQVSFDTRDSKSLEHSAFFALKGQSDGHLYLKEAAQKAHVLVIEYLPESYEHLKSQITLLKVSKTSQALQRWAGEWRKKNKFKLIGLTGSTGKTSAKHFCQQLFSDDPSICFSPKSYNNNLGVSLGILSTDKNITFLVQEIGTSAPGEIRSLCSLAHPDISVCTTVQPSHLKELKNIENIFLEKNDIYQKASIGIFNLDNVWTQKMKEKFKKTKLTFSEKDPTADVFLKVKQFNETSLTLEGHIQNVRGLTQVPIVGKHCVTSLLVALSIGLCMNKKPEEMWNQLSFLKNPPYRLEWMSFGKTKILFDAYNSNPASMKVFLKHLEVLKKPCVLCIGDMLDLGDSSHSFHRELGQLVRSMNLRYIFFVGKHRFDFEKGLEKTLIPYELHEKFSPELGLKVSSFLKQNDVLALKASRDMKFERFLDFFREKK